LPTKNSRRWLRLAVLGGILGLCLFVLDAGNLLVVDNPQPSDVIVVLAGETYHRPTTGLQLLDRGYGRHMLMDVPAAATIYKYSQVQLAEEYVHDLPQPASVEICPIEGLSTREESHDVVKCLAHETGSRILIVTSDFHTRRALSIFRHEITGKTFSVAAAHDDSEFGTRWWAHREWAKTCLYEWIRVVWWNAVERWK
jgi:hypothetical protein